MLSKFILFIHILSGFISLACGLVPMLSPKGGKVHKKYGHVYFYAMAFVAISAILLSIIKPNGFLFNIAIFSFYLTFTGVRIIQIKNHPENNLILDNTICYAMLLVGIYMAIKGLYDFNEFHISVQPVSIVFGVIAIALTLIDLIKLKNKSYTKKWLSNHITKMGGSYIATFTAFAVVNFSFLPALVNWLMPTAVGSILITYANLKYRKDIK